ncbi:MAG: DUF192 domain-containing protein [Pseudomonadales bacterium]|nr:DUF192 domain-containing protein [Pseudomonadales bacterium]
MKVKSNAFYKVCFLILMIIIVISMLFFLNSERSNTKTFSEVSDMEKVKILIKKPDSKTTPDGQELEVEVVNTRDSTSQGLSDRDQIGSDGMLFIFPDESQRTFWMFKMKFDLDFVWIRNNKVVGLTKNVKKPAPNTDVKDLELIYVNALSDKVLELNSGDIDKYKIEVSDVVILK